MYEKLHIAGFPMAEDQVNMLVVGSLNPGISGKPPARTKELFNSIFSDPDQSLAGQFLRR